MHYRVHLITMRTSSQRLAAVRKREAMLLASVYSNNLCLNLDSYLEERQSQSNMCKWRNTQPPRWSRSKWMLFRKSLPECPDGGEALHCLWEVGQERELGTILQLLEVPDRRKKESRRCRGRYKINKQTDKGGRYCNYWIHSSKTSDKIPNQALT